LRKLISPVVVLWVVALWAISLAIAGAQTPPPTYLPQTKFSRGQDVVPSFDGWLRNPDGSFTMVFGYMNRNYEEELAVPAGPYNAVSPGPADQGQPTYFLPRRHAWVFRVKVPADWGNKELVWTINSHDRIEKAFASLQPEEEITERLIMSRGGLSPGLDDPNKPPSITIEPAGPTAVDSPVRLTAMVTDDGLPKPRAPKATPAAEPGRAQTNTNIPTRLGLNVTWMQYRGPGRVTFENMDPILVNDGKAINRAMFSVPGTYVLRATANDGELSTTRYMTQHAAAVACLSTRQIICVSRGRMRSQGHWPRRMERGIQSHV
jgi:hypothetical protein